MFTNASRVASLQLERLKDEYTTYKDGRVNEILYMLTISTIVVMPGQLLTGMYGMNFQKKDGDPGIPELMFTYPWGYVWFWCCFLTCSLSLVAYFKYYRRWI